MSDIKQRRQKRALEASRDKLMEQRERARVSLAKVRAELKAMRQRGGK